MTPEQIAKPNTEDAHQMAFFAWIALHQDLHPVFRKDCKLLFFCVNENKVLGHAGAITGARFKAMGKKSGVSDIICLWPVPTKFFIPAYHGLLLEMKNPSGVQSPEQKIFQKQVEIQGYCYRVAYTWYEAVAIICDYLGVKVSLDNLTSKQ